jgi:hypothetical protein
MNFQNIKNKIYEAKVVGKKIRESLLNLQVAYGVSMFAWIGKLVSWVGIFYFAKDIAGYFLEILTCVLVIWKQKK